MTKNCPKCGKELPDNAKFCMDCGYSFDNTKSVGSSIFSNGSIFIILIAAILVIGGIFILTTSMGGNDSPDDVVDDVEHVDLTITDVGGWDSDSGKESYTLYTSAIFNGIPDDSKGYNIKTTYFDSKGNEIGHETETLESVYYETNYDISFGFYTTYKLPDPDHVTVDVIKNGKVIDSYTETINKNKIDFLN
ncbi:zinc ribbon domain-containing protein [Methanobrevibacter sp.]|uniref:zinc ribbon domain-containing protein n=1 Tax=Methanobrevibacter sp. TaxID=66852 RepID=UPI0025FE7183|nr:zinc ribbon domain-containing protein [Methanobrevibacter sp.]MBQ2666117.1 zinc ribbon domain-containing protein [Methanobrevibacter sp.]